MKKNIFWIIIIAAAVSLALAGCGGCGGSGRGLNLGGGDNALIGTWEWDAGSVAGMNLGISFRWTFTRDSFTSEMMGIRQTMPYRVRDNAIIFQEGNTEVEMQYRITGDTLSLDLGEWMGGFGGWGIPSSLDFKRVSR